MRGGVASLLRRGRHLKGKPRYFPQFSPNFS
jgi:hypothetical protein